MTAAKSEQSREIPRPGSPSPERTPAKRPRATKRPGMTKFSAGAQSKDSKQLAAVILEVLAGMRTPSEAAEALVVSVPRYYALEGRALEGLLKACEPRPKGPRHSLEREVAHLRADIHRLQREGARSQALLRAAQKVLGLPSTADRAMEKLSSQGNKGRKRKPVARALRAVKVLRTDSEPRANSVEPPAQGGDNDTPRET